MDEVFVHSPVPPYRQAIIHPIGRSEGGIAIGAFSGAGAPIENSLLTRGTTPFPLVRPCPPAADLAGDWIYGGPVFDHFGHFLLESLARVSRLKASALPILWIRNQGDAARAWRPWQAEILALLGLDKRRQAVVTEATEVERLFVPAPGFVVRHLASVSHFRSLAAFRFQTPKPGRRVWLSRAGINPANPRRVVRVENEEAVEAELRRRGWHIFSPQKHGVAEQLSFLSDAEVISGFVGSAFHLLALAADVRAKVRIVRRGNDFNANFRLIAAAKGLDQTEFGPRLEPGSAPGATRLLDPDEVVAYCDETA